MTLEQFATVLGVTERMVSNWEQRGESITPRAANQEALDRLLAVSPLDVHERFAHATGLAIEAPDHVPVFDHQQMSNPPTAN
jgi:transcriptional regulator with XRE-family HTH domain